MSTSGLSDVSFHKYLLTSTEAIAKAISNDLHAFIITNEMPHMGLFASHAKATAHPFPDHFQLSKWIRNEVVGTSLVIEGEIDALFKFGEDLYLASTTIAVIEYSDVMRVPVQFVIARSAEKASELVKLYYDSRATMFREQNAILDPYGQMIKDFRRLDWGDIFLPNGIVERVSNEIDTFFKSKEEYIRRKLEWRRGILLVGPAGNGKTSLCRAISTHAPVTVVYCEVDEDASSMVKSMKETIGKHSPCVAIFEDADAFGGDVRARAAFLNMMDGIASCNGVFFVASTNDPDKLDFAFTNRPSRFDSYYVIANPQPEQRRQILATKIGEELSKMPNEAIERLVAEMDGFSAAAVQEVAVGALLESLRSGLPIDEGMIERHLRLMRNHSKAAKDGASKWMHGTMGFN